MTIPTGVLDACVLVPIRLATTLLWLAEAGLFQPLWSSQILHEVERNLPKLGVTPTRAMRRVASMRSAFGAEALVDGFDNLIDDMDCDPKDRHVLAVAVHEHADALVTFNLKDFPTAAASPYGVAVLHPETFLLQLLNESPEAVLTALNKGVLDLRKPPVTAADWLRGLTPTVPTFANLAADALRDPLKPISPSPALEVGDESEALAAFGEPGDWTDPAQVAISWWSGLLDDRDLTRALTFAPAAWGDYNWAADHVADRSLASKVIAAVDAPDRIAYLRFMPEVAQTSRVFAPFLSAVTFLTLVKLEDGTWRVWGLGPATPSAKTIFRDDD